jgi:hypothetical protein
MFDREAIVRTLGTSKLVAGAAALLVAFSTAAAASAATTSGSNALHPYGPNTVRVPYTRIYTFRANCAALPCKVQLGQRFYVGSTPLSALRELQPGPIEMRQNGSPGEPWVSWYVKADFNQTLLQSDLARYGRLTMKVTGKITDATGASAHATRTLTLVPTPLPVFIAGSYRGRRPVDIDISGDAGDIVTNLHWSNWGNRSASASGTSNIQNCIPNCASGTDTPVPTSITLEDPSSKGYFTKLVEHRDGTTEIFYYTPGHLPDNWPGDAS